MLESSILFKLSSSSNTGWKYSWRLLNKGIGGGGIDGPKGLLLSKYRRVENRNAKTSSHQYGCLWPMWRDLDVEGKPVCADLRRIVHLGGHNFQRSIQDNVSRRHLDGLGGHADGGRMALIGLWKDFGSISVQMWVYIPLVEKSATRVCDRYIWSQMINHFGSICFSLPRRL
jgi:hypothetical protein